MQIADLKTVPQADLERIMRRSAAGFADVLPVARRIMEGVRKGGDRAVRRYNKRFGGADVHDLRVSSQEIDAAFAQVSPGLIESLQAAMANIETFHKSELIDEAPVQVQPGIEIRRVNRPIERVGLYVPGGRGAYPSSVLMMGVPARLAGCRTRIMCIPPDKDGRLPPAALVAARLAGITDIFKVGGAQAIAAMAHGTETLPHVYKLFGPGNRFVTAAKVLAAADGLCAIDMPAGPSEVLIVADESANPRYLAADLICQAEHAEDSACVLVCTAPETAQQTVAEIERQMVGLPTRDRVAASLQRYGMILVAETLDEALALSNEYAPEHLQVATRRPMSVLDKISNAGSIFLGPYAPTAAGDYATGSNHVLPTGEYAKMYAPLSVDSFIRKLEVQEVSKAGLARIRPAIDVIADAEGFPAHRRSVDIRFEE